MKKLTQEEFEYNSNVAHNYKYTYSNAVYTNKRAVVIITCPIHGDFTRQAGSHMSGSGTCAECSTSKRSASKLSSTNKFIAKAHSIHGDKYNYSNTVYITSATKVIIECTIHGDFLQSPSEHLRGSGCSKCTTTLKLTRQEVLNRFYQIHGTSYGYDNVHYKDTKTPVSIDCLIHGEFLQTPGSHFLGRGCPLCADSGFDVTKEATLYYLKFRGVEVYKIGITNRTVEERFLKREQPMFTVIKEVHYKNGMDCYKEEQRLLNIYKKFKYTGDKLLKSGNTELITTKIVELEV